MKKYELTTDTKMVLGRKLFRIKALVSFGNVKIGDLGGYIEKEENLSQEGNAWVSGNAEVSGNAKVSGNTWVSGNAEVSGNAKVSGNADYATAQGFGSVYRVTTFFREKTGEVGVKCGCFYGTLAEFRKKVKETHGDSKKAKEYLMLADLMEYRFSDDE
nr:MAG TPA: Putative transferase, nesg, ydcK, Structural Genomics.38A [Caudoviricetes sp.]